MPRGPVVCNRPRARHGQLEEFTSNSRPGPIGVPSTSELPSTRAQAPVEVQPGHRPPLKFNPGEPPLKYHHPPPFRCRQARTLGSASGPDSGKPELPLIRARAHQSSLQPGHRPPLKYLVPLSSAGRHGSRDPSTRTRARRSSASDPDSGTSGLSSRHSVRHGHPEWLSSGPDTGNPDHHPVRHGHPGWSSFGPDTGIPNDHYPTQTRARRVVLVANAL